ncbi:MAG: AI-2E family transporter [Actinobacteria bacterium]|nr:AI-2E family transporter [Actinomycetota bacterium]
MAGGAPGPQVGDGAPGPETDGTALALLAGLDHRVPRWILRFIVLAVVGVVVIYVAGVSVARLRDLLAATVAALFFSFALEPAVNWLQKHGWKRWVATITVILFVIVLIGAFIGAMVPLIIQQVQQLISDVPGWVERVSDLLERILDRPISNEWIKEQISRLDTRLADFGADVARNVFGVGLQLFKFLFYGFTIAFFTFYLIADAPRLRRWICSMMRPERQRRVLWAWETAIDKTGGYIYSRLIMGAIAALAMFVVLEILGVPFPVPLALWMGIFSQLIPTIGTYIAAVLPLFVAFLYRPLTALILLIYIVVYQIVENYALAPKISAHTMQIHAGIAFAATIAGATLFGVTGALLALPVAAILQAGVETYVSRQAVVSSHLTGDAVSDLAGTAGGGRPGRIKVTVGRGVTWVRRVFRRDGDGPWKPGPGAGGPAGGGTATYGGPGAGGRSDGSHPQDIGRSADEQLDDPPADD